MALPHPLALDRLAARRRRLRDARGPARDRRGRDRAGARRRLLGAARLGRRLGAVLAAEGVAVAPFRPSNVGFARRLVAGDGAALRAPVKPVRLAAGGRSVAGEFVVSARGVEGGGIYALAHRLRDGAPLDARPRCPAAPRRRSRRASPGRAAARRLANHLRKTLGLSPVKIALLREFAPRGARRPRRDGARR